MDLELYFRVLWRFRAIVLVGFLVAVMLAFLSFASISFAGGSPHLAYRQAERWESEGQVFVTQRGFPWGRTTPQYLPSKSAGTPPVQSADVGRLSSLAVLYSNLATTDPVLRLMHHRPNPKTGALTVATIAAPPFSNPAILPLISIKGDAYSEGGAIALTADMTQALVRYITDLQSSNRIPVSQRVVVQVVKRPDRAVLIGKRGKTLPAVVFLAVVVATIGLAFVLENLRPRVRLVEARRVEPEPDAIARRG